MHYFVIKKDLRRLFGKMLNYSLKIVQSWNNFQTIIQYSPKHYPIIILGDFNVRIIKTIIMQKI
jgi:hypothetical protein